LLPSLAVSKSNEHAWSPGTLWLSAATLLTVLDEIARCVATTPVRKIVFLNRHGGNSSLLQVASRDILLAHGLRTFVMHPSVPPDQGGTSPAAELGMCIHAGVEETSVTLHLRPDLVRLELGKRSVPEHLASFERVSGATAAASMPGTGRNLPAILRARSTRRNPGVSVWPSALSR